MDGKIEVIIFTELFKFINENVNEYVISSSREITSILYGVFCAGFMLHCVILVYGMIFKGDDALVAEVAKNVAILALVAVFSFNGDAYFEYIVPFVSGAGSDIANAITGADLNNGLGGTLDKMASDIFTAINTLFISATDELSWYHIGDWFITFLTITILIVSIGSYVLYCAMYLAIATIMVGILLCIGPAFVMAAYFPATKQMFSAWVGSCLNYILLVVMYSLAFGITFKLLTANIELSELGLWNSVQTAILAGICIYALHEIPKISSILTGGVGIGGLAGSIGGSVSKMTGQSMKVARVSAATVRSARNLGSSIASSSKGGIGKGG